MPSPCLNRNTHTLPVSPSLCQWELGASVGARRSPVRTRILSPGHGNWYNRNVETIPALARRDFPAMSPAEEHALRCRRNFLATSASGIGLAALASLLRDDGLLAGPAANPLAARVSHFAPKAKACICIYLEG